MTNIKTVFGISALAVAAATAFYLNISSANAATSCGSRAECACQVALDSGSRAALRKYLQMFPRADTACNALNTTIKSPPHEDNRQGIRSPKAGQFRSFGSRQPD